MYDKKQKRSSFFVFAYFLVLTENKSIAKGKYCLRALGLDGRSMLSRSGMRIGPWLNAHSHLESMVGSSN